MRRIALSLFVLSAAIALLAEAPAPRAGRSVEELSAMIDVAGGSFRMGDLFGILGGLCKPVHQVTLSPFRLMKFEVSMGLWRTVRAWAVENGYEIVYEGGTGNRPAYEQPVDELPASGMTWYDAVKWCNAWSEMEGKTPVYCTDSGQGEVYKTGVLDLANDCVKWDADGYRLPTEAEWEFAARERGRKVLFANGKDYATPNEINYFRDTQTTDAYDRPGQGHQYARRVGSYPANALGFHEMSGNVAEWCWDWLGDYPATAVKDPRGGPKPASRWKINRGGDYSMVAMFVSAADRGLGTPDNREGYPGRRGFRAAQAVK